MRPLRAPLSARCPTLGHLFRKAEPPRLSPQWEIEAGAVYLGRDGGRRQVLAVEDGRVRYLHLGLWPTQQMASLEIFRRYFAERRAGGAR